MAALAEHHRHQLAHHERTGDKDGHQHHPRPGEHDLQVVFIQPAAQRAIGAVEEQINQARHHRRHRKRDIQQGQQQLTPREVKARYQPGQQYAKHQIHRDGDQGNHHRQPDGVEHVRIGQVLQRGHNPFTEGLHEDVHHRHDENECGDQHAGTNQKPFAPVDAGRVIALQLRNFRHQ